MFYVKNLPAWERFVRVLGALLMATCAYHFWNGPGGLFFAATSGVTLLTAAFGFCPMCALAGRRLDQKLRAEE